MFDSLVDSVTRLIIFHKFGNTFICLVFVMYLAFLQCPDYRYRCFLYD